LPPAESSSAATKRAGSARHPAAPAARARVARAAGTEIDPPRIRLGRTRASGLAPALFSLLERGAERRPALVNAVRGRVVFRYHEGYTPTRISFGPRAVVVEDGNLRKPDLVIAGSLPDIVHVAAAPSVRGVPSPHSLHGLVAIARVARGRVRIEGDRALARSVLRLLALDS
jgi:hypothetical protein